MDVPRQTVVLETSTARVLLVLGILLFVPTCRAARSSAAKMPAVPPQQSAQEFVKKMVQSELKSENEDKTHWRFRKVDVKPGRSETWDVIETKKGEIERLLDVNGHPLTPQERAADHARLTRFLRSASEEASKKKTAGADSNREQQLLSMLPNALVYQYAGKDGDLVKLTFQPNPSFHAATREAEVFHHMSGEIIFNAKTRRLAQLRGQLVSRVNFGYGLLGHLNKGGTFDVKQGMVAQDHWDMTLLDTELTGKALFFKTISVREKLIESDYQRVPDTLTLEQAAQILEKSSAGRSPTPVKGS